MAGVVYLAQARLDLKAIFHYIAQENPDAAAQVLRMIDAKAHALVEMPHMGQSAEELTTGLRRFPAGSFVIFYRESSSGIEVVRVLHGARDIEAAFDAPDGLK